MPTGVGVGNKVMEEEVQQAHEEVIQAAGGLEGVGGTSWGRNKGGEEEGDCLEVVFALQEEKVDKPFMVWNPCIASHRAKSAGELGIISPKMLGPTWSPLCTATGGCSSYIH